MSTMKLLTSRASFLLSSSSAAAAAATHFPLYILQVSHFSSTASYSPSDYSNIRRHDGESRSVRVSVWWDFENCNLPAGVNVFKVATSIIAAVRANGIRGPVHITAFGDILQLSRDKQEALSSTGVNLTHIPHGGKKSADRSLLLDLMYWVSQNPPPAHLFVISGDRDFAGVLHRLRMRNYNILLASPESAPGVLCSAATIMWHWHDLLKGNNLIGKHFNQPPDGPHGSWYGHYKLPLEKSVLDSEQQSSSQNDELLEPSSDVKLRPIPKVVVRKIWQILNNHPKGLSIVDLRSKLGKSKLSVDKDLYGYKKFSHFLLAMPDIIRLQSKDDRPYMVYSATSKNPESSKCNSDISDPVSNYEDQDTHMPSTSNSADSSVHGGVDRNFPLPTNPEKSSTTPSTDLNAKKAVMEDLHYPLDGKVVNKANKPDVDLSASLDEKVVNVTNEQNVDVASGQERKWFAANSGGAENENHKEQEKKFSFLDGSKKICPLETNIASNSVADKEEGSLKSTASVVDSAPLSSSSLFSYESELHNKAAPSEGCTGKDNKSPSYFSKIKNWCKFWISTPSSEEMTDHSGKIPPSIGGGGGSVKHELLSDNSFWSEMESMMNTHKGSRLISESRTREQMAHILQNEGPLCLRSLSENDLLLLVDLLISEKKWVVECPSQIIPFKLASSFVKNSCLGDPHSTNELKSIILDMQSQSNTQRSSEHDKETKSENAQHTEAKLVSDENPLLRSRLQVLANCQKLLKEILKEHPEGYEISLFKNLFLERYGYRLDYQKLGYKKLAYLLQIMPRVKVESGLVIPDDKAPDSLIFGNAVSGKRDKVNNRASNSDSELFDPSSKYNDSDSPWEELGPIASVRSKKSELKSPPTKRASERHRGSTYEPSLSDDELSDSEKVRPPISGAEGQKKATVDNRESALLQILDSWHGSKESDITKVKSENVDGTVDCSKAISKLFGSSVTGGTSETSLVNQGKRQRPQKSYTFVSDPVIDSDDLIDEIFGGLKKSTGSRMKGRFPE